MNENKGLAKDLPIPKHTFFLDEVGKITKKRYQGEFECKVPNTKDLCMIAKHRAFLNGDMADHLDVGTLRIHEMISHLRYTLINYPSFWKTSDLGYELMDANIIKKVHDEVLAFENDYLKQLWGEVEESEETQDEPKGE